MIKSFAIATILNDRSKWFPFRNAVRRISLLNIVDFLLSDESLSSFQDTSEVGQEARELEGEFFELLKNQLPGLHSSICSDS